MKKAIIVNPDGKYAIQFESYDLPNWEKLTTWKNVWYYPDRQATVILTPTIETFCQLIQAGYKVSMYGTSEVEVPCLENMEPHRFKLWIPATSWKDAYYGYSGDVEDTLQIAEVSRWYGGRCVVKIDTTAWGGKNTKEFSFGRMERYESPIWTKWEKPEFSPESLLLRLSKQFLGGIIKYSQNKAEGYCPWNAFYYIPSESIDNIPIKGINGWY